MSSQKMANKLLERFNKAVERKRKWSALYNKVITYTAPQRGHITHETVGGYSYVAGSEYISPPKPDRGELCDSVGEINAETFVGNLLSTMTPPGKKWAKLVPNETVMDPVEKKALSTQLDKMTDILFSYINNSNIYSELPSAYLDLVAGTGAIMIIENPDPTDLVEPIKYVSVPLSELYLEESSYSSISSVFRQYGVVGREILNVWSDAVIPSELAHEIKQDPEMKHVFIEAITPAPIIRQKYKNGRTKQEEVSGYRYQVLHKASNTIIVERDMDYFPFVILRWSVAPSEIYGRGVGMFCLADLISLNVLKMRMLLRADREANPLMCVDKVRAPHFDKLTGDMGEVLEVKQLEAGLPIQYLQIPGSFTAISATVTDLEKRINEAMYAHPIGEIDGAVKTATEITSRNQEQARRLGTACERVKYEGINQIIKTTIYLLAKKKVFNSVFELDDYSDSLLTKDMLKNMQNNIYIKYESPYTSAQGVEDAIVIQNFLATIGQTLGPEAFITIKPYTLVRHLASFYGIKPDILVSEEEYDTIRQTMAQGAEIQQQMMQDKMAGG